MNIQHIGTISPVTVRFGYTEGGEFITESCNHAGAEETVVSSLEWDVNSRCFTPDGMAVVTFCDKCGAEYNEVDEEWL